MARLGQNRNAYRILMRKEGKNRHYESSSPGCKGNIKMGEYEKKNGNRVLDIEAGDG